MLSGRRLDLLDPTPMDIEIAAWLEAVQIAGFTTAEADKFFGKPDPTIVRDSSIRLRPPVEVRNDFTKRHSDLMDQL